MSQMYTNNAQKIIGHKILTYIGLVIGINHPRMGTPCCADDVSYTKFDYKYCMI